MTPSSVIRQGDHPELPAPLPGLLEGYLTVLAGAGGVGKTFLAEQTARHLASGVMLGRFPLPADGPVPVWCLFLEDVAALTQARSLDVAAFGTLPEDQHEPGSGHDTLWYADDALRGIASLRARLAAAKEGTEDGGPALPELIIIDYLHLFIGFQPAGASPVEWERQKLTALRELAIEYGCHILVLTHMTKEGKVNGTSSLLNAVDSLFVVEAKEDRNYAALLCKKMRVSPMTDYTLTRRSNGTWGFDDNGVFVSEALADGIMRDILAILRVEGPRTLSQLTMHPMIPGTRNAIRQALTRGRRRGWVTTYAGHWRVVPGAGDVALQPPEPPAAAAPPDVPAPPADCDRDANGLLIVSEPDACRRCGGPTPFRAAGIPMHAGGFCQPAPAAAVPAPRPADAYEEEEPERGPFRARDLLVASVKASRYHPIPRIKDEFRQTEPWTLWHDRNAGEPDHRRWSRTDVPMGGRIISLDRNGSFPSACSSVPLAPNKLSRVGPIPAHQPGTAGMYLVDVPEWHDPKMPHPLGRQVYDPESKHVLVGQQVWIATPHLLLLGDKRLAGRLGPWTIRDSWTGVSNASMFQKFYEGVRDARAEYLALHTPEDVDNSPYTLYKQAVSKAIRGLWPKRVRTAFWRPDWRLAVVSEASVRHWLKADTAVRADAFLVALRDVDQADFWVEDDQLPYGYELGDGYGQVKIK